MKARVVSLSLYLAAASLSAGQQNAPAGNSDSGKEVFLKVGCYECHGREGQGSSATGPRIAPNPIPFNRFISYVRKPAGEMPPYTPKVLKDSDLADIYAFLQSRPKPPSVRDTPLLKGSSIR